MVEDIKLGVLEVVNSKIEELEARIAALEGRA